MATPSSPPTQDSDQDHHKESLMVVSTPTPIPSNQSFPKKSPPLPWSHQETINLIQAYQEKWYSLKKGQLKAFQWEEVAVTVAARCGYDEPSKTATQCRHKIEKLRKRYRAERQKPNPNAWQYFDVMDRMERGPLPISARPMAVIQYHNNSNSSNEEEDNYDDDDNYGDDVNYYDDSKKNKSKSINHIVRGRVNANKSTTDRKLGGGGVDRVFRDTMFGKRKECFLESDDDDDEEEEEEEEEKQEGGREVVAGLAAEIKAFAERFVRMENKKMEMMRETERCRMEMENKRMEMILESQRKIVDTIGRAFGSHKKLKMAQEL